MEIGARMQGSTTVMKQVDAIAAMPSMKDVVSSPCCASGEGPCCGVSLVSPL